MQTLQGGAPPGVEFIDHEEEYVVDERGVGSWKPLVIKKAKAPGGGEARPRAKLKVKPVAAAAQQVEEI